MGFNFNGWMNIFLRYLFFCIWYFMLCNINLNFECIIVMFGFDVYIWGSGC